MVNHTAAILEKKGGPPGKDRPYVRGEEALKKHYSYIKLIMQDGMSRNERRPPAIKWKLDWGSSWQDKKKEPNSRRPIKFMADLDLHVKKRR